MEWRDQQALQEAHLKEKNILMTAFFFSKSKQVSL